jgi:hypothetical protein
MALTTMNRKNKRNCWEIKKCGREPGGSHVYDLGVCPATTIEKLNGLHSGKNGGRACWFVVGTFCMGDIQGTYAKKYKSCIYCDFYKTVKEEEYPKHKSKAINTIGRHLTVQPFADTDGVMQSGDIAKCAINMEEE